MQRILFLIYVCFIGCICSYGQYNNIFIIDCSRSMICPNADKTKDWKTEERDIRWNPAKNALKEWINGYEDNDIITLLLFNDKIVSTISKKKKDIDWDNIDEELDSAVENHHGKTSICNAWIAAERYFDSTKYNFFYVITDGKCEHEKDESCCLVENIRAFCGKIPEGSHGYVLKLDHASFPQDVIDALNSSPCLTQLPTGPIPKFGGFISDEVNVTTSNMKSGGADRTSALGFDRKANYPIIIKSIDEPYFDVNVTNGCVNNGVLTFDVRLKNGVNLNDLKHKLNSDNYHISVVLSSNDVEIVRNDNISINVTLKPISELQILNDVSQIELGKTTWYNDFIIPKSYPDTLSYTITPHFNEEAINNKASASFKISNLPSSMQLFVNDKECSDNTFSIDSNVPIKLQFVAHVPCTDFDVESTLKLISSKNLDRVNGLDMPSKYSISIGGEVKENINPLKLSLILIGIAILIILIIRIFYNLILRKTMIGRLLILDTHNLVVGTLGDLSGFHVGYFTGGPSRIERGLINTLFTSKRIYMHIPGLKEEIKVTGHATYEILIHKTKNITVNGLRIATGSKRFSSRNTPIINLDQDYIPLIKIKYI